MESVSQYAALIVSRTGFALGRNTVIVMRAINEATMAAVSQCVKIVDSIKSARLPISASVSKDTSLESSPTIVTRCVNQSVLRIAVALNRENVTAMKATKDPRRTSASQYAVLPVESTAVASPPISVFVERATLRQSQAVVSLSVARAVRMGPALRPTLVSAPGPMRQDHLDVSCQ